MKLIIILAITALASTLPEIDTVCKILWKFLNMFMKQCVNNVADDNCFKLSTLFYNSSALTLILKYNIRVNRTSFERVIFEQNLRDTLTSTLLVQLWSIQVVRHRPTMLYMWEPLSYLYTSTSIIQLRFKFVYWEANYFLTTFVRMRFVRESYWYSWRNYTLILLQLLRLQISFRCFNEL